MIQPFEITQEQLKYIEYIAPANKNFNLWLGKEQHFELSKSGKTLILIQEDDNGEIIGSKKFIVSKTVFCLKESEESENI